MTQQHVERAAQRLAVLGDRGRDTLLLSRHRALGERRKPLFAHVFGGGARGGSVVVMRRTVAGGRGGRLHLLRRLGLGGVVFFHASLESLDALGEVAHDARQFAGAEQQDDDDQNDQPMQQAEGTHGKTSEIGPIEVALSTRWRRRNGRMSSENHPVRKAWIQHARSLFLRKWLAVALGIALAGWATTAIVRHHKAATQSAAVAPPQPTPKPATAKTAPPSQPAIAAASPSPDATTTSTLRSALGGETALILAPSPTLHVELPPPGATPLAPTMPDLPTVAVAPPTVHVVPSDRDTKQFGAVTMSDRKGRTFTIVP